MSRCAPVTSVLSGNEAILIWRLKWLKSLRSENMEMPLLCKADTNILFRIGPRAIKVKCSALLSLLNIC